MKKELYYAALGKSLISFVGLLLMGYSTLIYLFQGNVPHTKLLLLGKSMGANLIRNQELTLVMIVVMILLNIGLVLLANKSVAELWWVSPAALLTFVMIVFNYYLLRTASWMVYLDIIFLIFTVAWGIYRWSLAKNEKDKHI